MGRILKSLLKTILKNDAIRTILIIILVVLLAWFFGRKALSFVELNVGRVLAGRNDDYAVTNYRLAILLDNRNASAYRELSAIYQRMDGCMDLAESVLEAGLKENDDEKLKAAMEELQEKKAEQEDETGLPDVYFYGGNIEVAEDTLGAAQMKMNDNGKVYTSVYEYDEEHRLTAVKTLDESNNVVSAKEKKPDSEQFYSSDYEKLYEVTYKRDSEGRIISEQCSTRVGIENLSDKYGINYEITHGDEDTFELDDDMTLHMYSVRKYEVQYTYSDEGLLTDIVIDSNFIPYSVNAQYEKSGRVKKITIAEKNGSDEETRDFTYDANGNIVKKIVNRTIRIEGEVFTTKRTYTYKYTKEGQLTNEEQIYEYSDSASQKMEKGYTYDTKYFYDDNGNHIGDITHEDGIFKGSNRMEYDENNRMIKHSYYVSVEDCYYELLDYDENGNCIKTTKEYPYIHMTYIDTNEYDSNGKIVSGLYQFRNNKVSDEDENASESGNAYIAYNYDAKGQLESMTYSMVEMFKPELEEHIDFEDGYGEWFVTYDAMGTENGKQYEQYDSKGRLLVLANFDTENTLTSKYVYGYDRLGRPVSKTEYSQNGVLDYDYYFHYDEQNKLTQITERVKDNCNELEYDQNGLLIRETDKNKNLEYLFTYDETGKIIEVKVQRSGDKVMSYAWEYK